MIAIRLTPEEYIEIESQAKECGVSVSSYVRSRALEQSVTSITDANAISLFSKLGGLVKFAVLRCEDLHAQRAIDALARLAEMVTDRIAQGESRQLTPEVEQDVLSKLDTAMLQQMAKFGENEREEGRAKGLLSRG